MKMKKVIVFYDGSFYSLNKYLIQKHKDIENMHIEANRIIFTISSETYHQMLDDGMNISFIAYTGFIYNIIHTYCAIHKVCGYISAFFLIIFLSNHIFLYKYQISDDQLKNEIAMYCDNHLYNVNTLSSLEHDLKTRYSSIDWINIYRDGNVVTIEIKTKKNPIKEEQSYNPLIAMKKGVIAYFDVRKGNILKKINEIVYPGDILVESSLIDSSNHLKQVPVEGKVYGYTIKEISIEKVKIDIPKPFAFFYCLIEARNQVGKELTYDEKIKEENILQFSYREGTIKMKVLYTLYEDLTSQ